MRSMGLDVGDRTIGIAVADLLGFTAQGITTIKRKSKASDFEQLKNLMQEYDVETLVIGMPRNMNGTYGPRAEIVKEFSEELQNYITTKIVFWDERLSTVAATRILIEADVSRKKRKAVIDKMAAVIILQGYLDNQSMNN